MIWVLISIILLLGVLLIVMAAHKCRRITVHHHQPVLILTNYNNDGGFFWQLYNVLNHLCVCRQQGFAPVVLFHTGLYLEQRPEFTQTMVVRDQHNWFNHFFHPVNETQQDDTFWIKYMKANTVPTYRHNKDISPVMLFNKATLNSIPRSVGLYTSMWHQNIQVLPHIQLKVDRFKAEQWKGAREIIGLHFRGTDKLPSAESNEDDPLHVEYDFCYSLLKKHLAKDVVFFIATDEQPFVDFLKEKNLPMTSTNSLRSSVNTSGLFTNVSTSMCTKGKAQNAVCQQFNDLIDQSIHRGFPDASKYTKGEDVLIDVLLLSNCTTFYRSRGNVSNFIGYINPACTVVDMVSMYKKI